MEKSLKIRHWFLGRIYAAGQSSVKLESVRETARRFGVAQCTVSGVTAALIRDGWLIPKKGIGIYTNPQKMAKDTARKLIGFINGDGKMFYYNPESFAFFAAVGKALLESGFHFRNIQLESSTPEGIAEELQVSGVSAVIWCTRDVLIPEAVQKAVSATCIPLVCDIPGCAFFPVVREDFEAILRQWSRYFQAKHVRKVLLYLMPWNCRCFSGYFQQNSPEVKVETRCIGTELPERSYDLILTDADHLPEFQTGARNWREIPGRPGVLQLPDLEKMAKILVDTLKDPSSCTEQKIQSIIKEVEE